MRKLVIYTGPMKSGKTTTLLNKYTEIRCSSKSPDRVMLFKPQIDNRYSEHSVATRDGKMLQCTNLDYIDDILKYKDSCDIFFIDEFQFLRGDIAKLFILNIYNKKDFYIAGLNLTAERSPFGLMDKLFPYATEIQVLYGNCDKCGAYKKGMYTMYEGGKSNEIIVGDNNYLCVCEDCYINN